MIKGSMEGVVRNYHSLSLTGSEASTLSMSCSDTVETTLHSYLRYSGRLMQRRSAGLVARLKI